LLITLESDCLEIGLNGKQSTLSSEVSGVLLIALENQMIVLFSPLVVPISASGLQGLQPLVFGTK
jgi:hypothetical protein